MALRVGEVVRVDSIDRMFQGCDGAADVTAIDGERVQLFVRSVRRSGWYALHPTQDGWVARPESYGAALAVRRQPSQ